jgi:hypothetical protein
MVERDCGAANWYGTNRRTERNTNDLSTSVGLPNGPERKTLKLQFRDFQTFSFLNLINCAYSALAR